jgi:hypothetical protein
MDRTSRPFTDRVNYLRLERKYRYQDLVTRSDEARSSAWFNNLCNSSNPWVVGPPTLDAIPGLARLFEVSEARVSAMIAEEWYGVGGTNVSARAHQLAPTLDVLTDDDFARVEDLVTRLAKR